MEGIVAKARSAISNNYLLTILLISLSSAASSPPASSWSFDEAKGSDAVYGYSKFVPGVSGTALRFDGQTTSVVRAAARSPRLGQAFTVEAWAAIQTYPWTWCALVNQEKDRQAGFLFGIDPEGYFGLQLAVGGAWEECRSDVRLPLYAWHHLAAVFDASSGISLYWNGKPAGRKALTGKPSYAPEADLWIGRNLTPLGLSHEVKVVAEVAYSFDGLLDEVKIHSRALSGEEVRTTQARLAPSGPAPLRAPVLPSGPPGPGRFGAFATRLRYAEEWERPWRVGEAPDVVVRFDESGERLVFWRGTSFIPAWVTENGIWYTNEFYETQDGSMATSAEPMADKQARFSQARILESSPARAVVLWRYAPVTVETGLVFPDALTGWSDWVEETFTVYPDRTCVRKIRTWSSKPTIVPSEGKGLENFRQFHEAIIINPPGTRPEDNIWPDALTLANMKGETHTYSWAKDAPGFPADFDAETRALLRRISDQDAAAHKWLTLPRRGNILRVNLKAKTSPYAIVDPRGVAIDCYAGEIIRERS
ncbi:MAG: LamG domain-containing protein, partial [Candidatus Aminicenantes bacterium]|nr:LamG domain-containing protein [Candidatus Aminicenantes bacterium]